MSEKKSILTTHPVVASTGASLELPKPMWDVGKFNSLIWNNGYHAYIEKALRCPCVDRATGQASSVTCPNCMGRGWFFVDKRETRVISQSMVNIRRNSDIGEINRGTARITTRAVDKVGFMDRIILDDLLAWYSEVLRPVMFNGELVAYPIYEPLDISNIFLYTGADKKLLPLNASKYTVEGNRIVFDESIIDEVEVTDVNQKTPDISISIRYSYYPVYHVLDVNRELMRVRQKGCNYSDDQLTDMPILCECRKSHYIFDNQIWGREVVDNTVTE